MNESDVWFYDVWFYLKLTRTLILTDALEAYGLIELTAVLQHQTLPNVIGGQNAHDLTGDQSRFSFRAGRIDRLKPFSGRLKNVQVSKN